jgi:hypothetical protein
LPESRDELRVFDRRRRAKEADHRHRLLLRGSSERPGECGASGQLDELAPPHAQPLDTGGEQGIWLKRAVFDTKANGGYQPTPAVQRCDLE